MQLILTIISVVAAVFVVNVLQKYLMKFLGADIMFFSIKTKLWAYAICAALFMYLLGGF